MIIETQKVKVKWGRRTKSHYEKKGYIYTALDDEFEVDVTDLSNGSHAKVKYVCDYCNGKNQFETKDKYREFKKILKARKTNNKDCCGHMECKNKKVHEVYINNLVDNDLTFGHKFPHLISEWSVKNIKTPFHYSYGSESKVWWICGKGHEWEDTILHRTGSERSCPYCSNYRVCLDNCLQTLRPDLALEWHPALNGKLTPYDITCGTDKKYWWRCANGHNFYTSPSSRTSKGNNCPICRESKGEKRVRSFLESKQISLKSQYEFNGLVGLGCKNLKFDFAIFNKDNDLISLIEYDGEFHFNKYYEDDGHERLIEHDKRKNQYCNDNDIPLLRIPYWNFDNIEEILTMELTKYNLF
jgi:hypothetical protein